MPKSKKLSHVDKERAFTNKNQHSDTNLPESVESDGEDILPFQEFVNFGRNSNEPQVYDDFGITETGYYIIGSALTNRKGNPLNKATVFLISPEGRVILGEKDGSLAHPEGMSDLGIEAKQGEHLDKQIKITQEALDMAFRKNRRSDARWQHQTNVLETLELELKQVMKDIRHKKWRTAKVTEVTEWTTKHLKTLKLHETSKLEGVASLMDSENFQKYSALEKSSDAVELMKELNHSMQNLAFILRLARRKYGALARKEKAELRALQEVANLTQHNVCHALDSLKRSSGGSLVQMLAGMAEARRRAESTPDMELD